LFFIGLFLERFSDETLSPPPLKIRFGDEGTKIDVSSIINSVVCLVFVMETLPSQHMSPPRDVAGHNNILFQ
jgi:hypothetical protein